MGKKNSINITVRWLAGKEAKQPGETWDSNLPGFGVRRGKKKRTFFVMTRVAGRQRRFKVGDVALMDLPDAREKALAIKDGAARGLDPAEAEKAARREAARSRARTFRVVAGEYMDQPKRAGHRSRAEQQRKLNVDIFPAFGDMPINTIDRIDVKDFLRRKAATSPVAANRLLSMIRSILNFALDEGYVEFNVAARIEQNIEKPRGRTLNSGEIRAFWRMLDSNDLGMNPATRVCLKFLLVTGQRRTEAASARLDEFDFAKDQWAIPGERTKNGLPHVVPLSGLALDLLDEMAEWSCHIDTDYVFPGAITGTPITGYSVSQAMKRALPVMNLEGGRATPHDLRRTVVTKLNETLDIEPHVVEAVVNHVSGAAKAGVAGIYNKANYLRQKRAALDAWGEWLGKLVSGEAATPSNVVELRQAKA